MNELRMNGRAAGKAVMASGLAAGLLAFFTPSVSAAIACRGTFAGVFKRVMSTRARLR
jgi:hypothetical protein